MGLSDDLNRARDDESIRLRHENRCLRAENERLRDAIRECVREYDQVIADNDGVEWIGPYIDGPLREAAR